MSKVKIKDDVPAVLTNSFEKFGDGMVEAGPSRASAGPWVFYCTGPQ